MNNFFLIAFLKISFESLKLFYLKYFSLLIILHGLHKNFLLLKLKVKRKNIRNLCLFFAPYHRAPYLWYKVYVLTTSNEKTSSNFGYYVTKRNVVNSSQILLILTTMPCHFEKKNFSFGHFHIRFVEVYFGGHIDLQFQLSFKKIEKLRKRPCLESNPRCSKLFVI